MFLEREKQPDTGMDETIDDKIPPTPTAKKSFLAVT